MDYFDFGIDDKCGFCASARVLSLSLSLCISRSSFCLSFWNILVSGEMIVSSSKKFFTFLMYRKPIEHFLKAVEEVTLKDIATISEKLMSSPLTMASWGDGIHS